MNDFNNDSRFDLALLPHQNIVPLLENTELLKEIMKHNGANAPIDAYLLGIMHGKRAERARKKARC